MQGNREKLRDTPSRLFILAAEHDGDDRFLLGFAYKEANLPHTLFFVNDGRQVIAYLKGDAPYGNRGEYPFPDLLLLDFRLPQATAMDVLEWMQRNGIKEPPVCILSGAAGQADQQKAIDLGAREFHVKPLMLHSTVTLLQNISARWLKPAPQTRPNDAP